MSPDTQQRRPTSPTSQNSWPPWLGLCGLDSFDSASVGKAAGFDSLRRPSTAPLESSQAFSCPRSWSRAWGDCFYGDLRKRAGGAFGGSSGRARWR